MPSRKNLLIITAVGIPILAYLAIGVFGIQTLFVDKTVDEAGPVFAASSTDSGAAETTDLDTSESDASDRDANSDLADDNEQTGDQELVQTSATQSSSVESGSAEPAETSDANDVVVLVEGSFIDKAHTSNGVASILTDGSSQRFLRFEDFETDNGPDLFVYLTSANAASGDGEFDRNGEFINLGELKGNIGDQNYEIPVNVDLDTFDTVVIWCRRFSVSFGAADLA